MNADQSYLPYKMRYKVGAVKWCKRLLEVGGASCRSCRRSLVHAAVV
jgi:hypothetical protein